MNGNRKMAQDERLRIDNVMSLFKEQWVQIRHLDSLDFRNMTLLPIVVSILIMTTGYLDRTDEQVPDYVPVFAVVVTVGLSFSGCYTTFRNWLCYMRRLSLVTALENRMRLVENGLIRESIQFRVPTTYRKFNQSLMKSIRFPLVVFYASLGGCGVMVSGQSIGWGISLGAFTVSVAILLYCDVITWLSLKKEFSALAEEKE